MDCECEEPESEAEDVKEDERNTAPYGTALYLQNEVRAYHLRRERKEANDAKLGKVKANGRSGGSAAPKQDRKAKDKKKGKEEEPCICENCMPWEEYKLFIKAKEKERMVKEKNGKYRQDIVRQMKIDANRRYEAAADKLPESEKVLNRNILAGKVNMRQIF